MKQVIIVLFSLVVYLSLPHPSTALEHQSNKEMQVHFINVGQGDSILIETPNGKKALIDGGPPSAGIKLVDYLKKKGINSIDLLVSTHPDIDHIGGLIPVIKAFKVGKILDSGKIYFTQTYFDYLEQINQKDIPVSIAEVDKTKQLDRNISLTILNTFGIFKSNNQSSIALRLRYEDIDFLLMGDVETRQEKRMVEKYNLESEILKVAHHGSKTSSSLAFLHEVKPDKAILSYSENNDYGHPVPTTIDKLLQVGAAIYSTAKAGDIVITTNGESYQIDVSGTGQLVQRNT